MQADALSGRLTAKVFLMQTAADQRSLGVDPLESMICSLLNEISSAEIDHIYSSSVTVVLAGFSHMFRGLDVSIE